MRRVFGRFRLLSACAATICIAAGIVAVNASPSSSSTSKPSGSGVAAVLSATAHRGGDLIIAYQSDPDTFDPQVCYDATCWDNMQMLFDRLYDYKTNTTDLVPEAAVAMPKISDGGRVYTIDIRPGMTFDNGQPVTAADFAYTFSRICNPATKSPVVGFWTVVVGCTAYAKHPVGYMSGIKARLEVRPAGHPDRTRCGLRLRDGHAARVGHPGRLRPSAGPAPAGSGPFEFVKYVPGQEIVLKANPHYWNKSLPYVSGVNETARR